MKQEEKRCEGEVEKGVGDEDEEKRAKEMKQRNMGRGHEDGHKKKRW